MRMPKFGPAAMPLLLLMAASASAQVDRASVIGNVSDTTGAAMPGVEVTVTNDGTNTSVKLTTDGAGAYTAINLIPGNYTLNATRSGFKPMVFRNFVLQVGHFDGKLLWDHAKGEFTNNADANQWVKPTFRKGWELSL